MSEAARRPGQVGWYAVAATSEMRRGKPLRRFLFGRPVVVYGDPKEPSVLDDRCPHRSAPLSGGRVVDGMVECPFHGWRFDGEGACRSMPCLPGAVPPRAARPHRAVARHGLVFVAVGDAAGEPPAPALSGGRGYVHVWSGLEVLGRIGEVAENFLDVTHTFTVHKHLLRGAEASTPSTVEIRRSANRVEVSYRGEGRPAGIVARMFEGERSVSVGRFEGPNVAVVEFHGPKGPRIAVTSYLTPTEPGKVGGYAVVVVPGAPWAGRLKFALLRPFAGLINSQDIRMLEATALNQRCFDEPPHAAAPTDYALRHIEDILDGVPGPAEETVTVLRALL